MSDTVIPTASTAWTSVCPDEGWATAAGRIKPNVNQIQSRQAALTDLRFWGSPEFILSLL